MIVATPTRTDAQPATGNRIDYPFDPIPKIARERLKQGAITRTDYLVLVVMLKFRRLYRGSCWTTKRTIAQALGLTTKTVQRSYRHLSDAGLIRSAEVAVPDPDEPRNRTGFRIHFLFIDATRPAGPEDRRPPAARTKPAGTPAKHARTSGPGEDIDVLPPQDTHVLPSQDTRVLPPEDIHVPQRSKDLRPSDGRNLDDDNQTKHPPMSSSFFNPSPQDQEPETPPKPEAPNPVPIAAESLPPVPELPPELAAHQAILAVLIARFAAFFGKSFDQARAIVVSLFGQYRALAQARGLRFEPGWIGEALDETDQAKAARRIKRGTPWTYFLGVLGNYARQGGPIREGPTEHQARATLEELSALGWTIVLKNDGTAAWGQIRAEACPLEELPESLSRRIKEQKEAIQALLEARQKPSQSWNPRS